MTSEKPPIENRAYSIVLRPRHINGFRVSLGNRSVSLKGYPFGQRGNYREKIRYMGDFLEECWENVRGEEFYRGYYAYPIDDWTEARVIIVRAYVDHSCTVCRLEILKGELYGSLGDFSYCLDHCTPMKRVDEQLRFDFRDVSDRPGATEIVGTLSVALQKIGLSLDALRRLNELYVSYLSHVTVLSRDTDQKVTANPQTLSECRIRCDPE